MNSVPLTWGAVLSTAPGPVRELAMAGDRVPVELGGSSHRLVGASVGPFGSAEIAQRGATSVLVIGELSDGAGGRLDAAAVLAGWARYNMAALRMWHGRYAIVLVQGDVLILATDHAASIPLAVTVAPDGVTVSTEVKALSARHGRTDLPGTYGAAGAPGVRRLRAGTVLRLDLASGRAEATPTWEVPAFREVVDPDTAVAQTRELLTAAVARQLRDDPVTVVLSGGIDSSGVTAVAAALSPHQVATVSMGTDAGDEFEHSRRVVDHVGTSHRELHATSASVIAALPRTIALAESADAEVLEYLLPLVVLYEQITAGPRRVLTGYGADIPLGGMHRDEHDLAGLDARISHDLNTFDGLGEMTPLLGGHVGLWTTHPYWDRDLLHRLITFEPGLKRRDGIDKWVLRRACADLLPRATVERPKLGIHEGSGTTSTWTAMLQNVGVRTHDVLAVKQAMARDLYDDIVLGGTDPADVDLDERMTLAAHSIQEVAS